ncbi:MAG: hypothetical protein HQ591_08110, partial [candidate division Zixibacteria bacterium]|nr:hypothetical protein [Candidatus Tariuqbacter arcticus]
CEAPSSGRNPGRGVEPNQAKIISLVPLTGKGMVKYLRYEYIHPAIGKSPTFKKVYNHHRAEILHLGKVIELGGFIAYHHAYIAVKRWDGELVLVNGMASLDDGIMELKV